MKNKAEEQGQIVESKFRGFELAHIDYTVESFTCEHCPNHCEIKKVQLPSAEPLFYGSRCDRYNLKKKTQGTEDLGAFEYRSRKLLEFAGLTGKQKSRDKAATTIGLPMALINYQLLPLFAQFFKELGFEVVLSGRTDKSLIRMGVESVTAQLCFPVKVAYGHIAQLIEKKVDYIFLPSIVSMTASFPENKYNQLCPYVQSLPYQAKAAFADKLGDTKILTAPLRLGEGEKLVRKTFIALGRQLKVSASAVRKAIRTGFAAQAGFDRALKEKGREILDRIAPDEKLFVLVSRPYNGCDEGVNLRLHKKLAELGARTIPMDMLDFDEAQLGDESLHRDVFWAYGQKILRAAEIIKKDPRLFAVYLSNFSCGPDSFLLTFFKDIMAGDAEGAPECLGIPQKPCLQLELDEHSADAGVITRIEAFLESLKHYRPALAADDADSRRVQAAKAGCHFAIGREKQSQTITRKRTLYIPYMGDCAYGVAACFRAYGQPAEVMPLADENTLLQGRKFTTGKECLPCTITTGDMLKVIKADGFEPDRAAFFMPGSSGPCRFGMYSCLHRLVLRYAGAANIPVISPNQDSNFYREFMQSIDGTAASGFMKNVWVATVGIDLLRKLILRLRPFAVDAKEAQQVYERVVKQYIGAVENRWSLARMRKLMGDIADEFTAVQLDPNLRKPRIGIVGEIYVRSHPFANMNVIARLEELGAACDLASMAEWIYYTNFTRRKMAQRRGQMRNFFTNVAQDYFQHKIERTLAEPLEEKFGKLAEEPTEHVIKLAEPYFHYSFEGEAILTVGKMVEYHHQGFGGAINVMPFTCMPSTVVSTQTMRLSADCGDMPILNLSFDGQEDSTLTTRLEAFVECARAHRRQSADLGQSQLIRS
jgi:predicted nucleotide-binding protein (sugar kinase/HSP70/actin superfamily)